MQIEQGPNGLMGYIWDMYGIYMGYVWECIWDVYGGFHCHGGTP